MPVRLRNGVYHTDFSTSILQPDGTILKKRVRVKVPGGITSRSAAQEFEERLKIWHIRNPSGKFSDGKIPFPILAENYLRYHKTNNTEATFIQARRSMRTFIRLTKIKSFSELSPALVQSFIARRLEEGVSRRTVNIDLTHLKSCIARNNEMGKISSNPIAYVKGLRTDRKLPEFLTEDECRTLLIASKGTVWFPIWLTLIKTGIRRGELSRLIWGDIDLKRKTLRIVSKEGSSTKTRRSRELGIDNDLAGILADLRPKEAKPADYVFATKTGKRRWNNMGRELTRAATKAGITKKISVHTLRHTCCSLLVAAGVDLFEVKEFMGHSNIQTTMIYAHLQPGKLQAVAQRHPVKLH